MLLEIAVGDAYGAGFEYVNARLVREGNNLQRYVQHPRHRGVSPGAYTDDAQMSLAIAEVIVHRLPWTPQNLAESFVRAFKRDPREGYARGFHQFLGEVRDGREFLARIRPDSDKSGAAMRAAPIGIFEGTGEVLARSTLQARLTHDTPAGIAAANAAALAAHYFIHRLGPKAQLPTFLDRHVEAAGFPGWSQPWKGEVGPKGWMSVQAAVTAIVGCDRMSELLKACIDFTGDVDTVAAIALGAASASAEIIQDLPASLVNGLERGRFGYDYIVALDQQFKSMMPARDAG